MAGMMNGLIPVVTPSTDVDVSGIGIWIERDSVDGVRDAINALDSLSDAQLRELSRKSFEAVGERYGRERFLRAYRAAVCNALGLDAPGHWDQGISDELRIPKIRRTRVWNRGQPPQRRVV
jgi:hypothetical protein